MRPFLIPALFALCAVGCGRLDDQIEVPALDRSDIPEPLQTNFECTSLDATSCELGIFRSCRRVDEFVEIVAQDCGKRGLNCEPGVGCVTCVPGARRCVGCKAGQTDCNSQQVEVCNAQGTGYEPDQLCSWEDGQACDNGACVDLCAGESLSRSYVGCTFFAVDLDNVALDLLNDASSQQFAVAVANPHLLPIEVQVELNDATLGDATKARVLERRTVAPNYLEVFLLPRREVDGSSEEGLNDGTHSALSPNAFRVTSSHPVTAYQFNPLDNVNVFSNDASLLLPTTALGSTYTVVGWPQTIADDSDPRFDFDPLSHDEDLRAFLTIVGTADETHVTVELGAQVVRVLGAEGIPESGPGDTIEVTLGPFEVLNLETAGFNADFTGSQVHADRVVAVFTGNEASDVPRFDDLTTRQCCADHLEEQLFPNRTLGNTFVVTHMPPRTHAVNAAATAGTTVGVAEQVETEWIRVLSASSEEITVRTTLDAPFDSFTLAPRGDLIMPADTDVLISASGPVAVLQALPSQEVTGIPREYPGGDPAIVLVPPREQYRTDYIFLTPDKYAFDFVTIAAPAGAQVRMDDRDVALDPACQSTSLAGGDVLMGVGVDVYRCQLSFPEVVGGPEPQVLSGMQDDGVHRIRASAPVGIVVYGFDRFVSYAYTGGLNLESLL